MASLSGAQTNAAIKVATTWGTAVTVGAGDKLTSEMSYSFNGQELIERSIGSGNYMAGNATRGNFIPTVSLTGDAGYRNNMDKIIAQMWGTSGAPTEVTTDQDDYKHTITFNTALNSKYLTYVVEASSATVLEFPTCATRTFGLRTTTVPGYLEWSAELLANTVILSSWTNDNADIQAATFTEGTPELAAVKFTDDYWIDDQSTGALASGDQYNITSFDASFTRPQDIIPEIKGSAGNSAPVSSGLFEGTLALTVKELADLTYFTVWSAETAKKSRITVEGSTIGSGTAKAINLYLPRMILVQEPQYGLSSEGTNTLSMTWRLLKASANPTGMSNTYPYWEITNGLSTSLLA